MNSPSFAAKSVLLLQGPVGPFFWNLAKDLRNQGASVEKFNFNAGDWLFYPKGAKSFKGHLRDWPAVLEAFLRKQRIDVVLLFGDCRPVHVCVRSIAHKLGCAVGVFEEGYIRPNYVTFEPLGVNGNSHFFQNMQSCWGAHVPPFILEACQSTQQLVQSQVDRSVGNTYKHAAMYGMAYFFAAWLGQRFWNNRLHHRRLTVRDMPWWLLSFGRKAWYLLAERDVRRQLRTRLRKNFFLVPLQVYNDAQVTVHSNFASVANFADHVVRSFAKALANEQAHGIPQDGESISDAVLVFKHHPMDRGHRNYTKLLQRLTQRYGLQGKVHYIHDQHLPSLLKAARGVVTVNSTVGLSALGHGAPVKVCGKAVYNIPELTFQGGLWQFWHLAGRAVPDQQKLQYFKHILIQYTQLNGSFYRKLPDVDWQCGVALDGQMAQRLWPPTSDLSQKC